MPAKKRATALADVAEAPAPSVTVTDCAPAAEYADSSARFVRECFGFPNAQERADGKDLYPWQREVLAAYDRGEPRIAIRSGHGVGKSTLAAWLLWHRLLCRFPQKSGVTAPSERQLFDALWAEFKAWGNRLKPELRDLVEIKAHQAYLIDNPSESFISIKTARPDQPEAIQGLHSTWELFIFDEASGGTDKTWEAAQSCLTGPHPTALLTGNPIRRSGFFYDAHTALKDLWWTRHVSRAEIANLDSDSYAKVIERESGGRHTNRYRVRVLGEFPLSEDDALIPFELVEPALTRELTVPKSALVIWGVQVARYGYNRSALAKRQSKILLEPVKWWATRDDAAVAAHIKAEWDDTPHGLRPMVICVNDVAVGGGVTAALRAVGLPAKGINVAELPSLRNTEHYGNLRTELWTKARDWFAARDVRIPESYAKVVKGDDLVGELTRQTYDFASKSGKLQVASPAEGESFDLAEAFVLTFAGEAAALFRARDQADGKPIERALSLV